MIRLIIGIDSIKAPMTGIGVYSANLCREFLKDKNIEISGLSRFGLLGPKELSSLVEESIGADQLNVLNKEAETSQHSVKKAMLSRAKDSGLMRSVYHSASKLAAAWHLRNLHEETIYHAPNFIGYGKCSKKVVTVHDLSHLEHPEMHPAARVRFMNQLLQRSINDASKVIVDTEFIKQQLLESRLVHSKHQNKISTIHLGVGREYAQGEPDNESLSLTNFNLARNNFILSLGTLEPRKNYERLVQSYLMLPEDIASEFPLVICGAYGWQYEPLIDLVASSVKAPYRVVLTGHLSQMDVIALVKQCRIFVYPSLYEGFGLPIVEAMASGVPVITSDIGSMLEVAGDAAKLVDPMSVSSICDAMKELLSSEKMCEEFSVLGQKRAAGFTWQRCAESTIKVYRNVIDQN